MPTKFTSRALLGRGVDKVPVRRMEWGAGEILNAVAGLELLDKSLQLDSAMFTDISPIPRPRQPPDRAFQLSRRRPHLDNPASLSQVPSFSANEHDKFKVFANPITWCSGCDGETCPKWLPKNASAFSTCQENYSPSFEIQIVNADLYKPGSWQTLKSSWKMLLTTILQLLELVLSRRVREGQEINNLTGPWAEPSCP